MRTLGKNKQRRGRGGSELPVDLDNELEHLWLALHGAENYYSMSSLISCHLCYGKSETR